MDWETRDKLVTKATQGNPGAIRVVIQLQILDNWREILQWLVTNKYTGIKLQNLYEEDCKSSVVLLSQWIDEKEFCSMRKVADKEPRMNRYDTL